MRIPLKIPFIWLSSCRNFNSISNVFVFQVPEDIPEVSITFQIRFSPSVEISRLMFNIQFELQLDTFQSDDFVVALRLMEYWLMNLFFILIFRGS